MSRDFIVCKFLYLTKNFIWGDISFAGRVIEESLLPDWNDPLAGRFDKNKKF